MYYSHFGLNQAPFKITPNTEFFFSGGNRGPVLEALIYAVTHGEGIVKVTGEVGSGKTMLCNMLQTRLPAHLETVYIANPSVSAEEILHAIAFELQINLPRDATRLNVMQALHEFLLKRYAAGKRVVVFVEESQSMPLATLEEIRLLSNLETSNDKLVQIVLFGQPELDENLRQANIRQLRERITHSFRLEPLNAGEIREYLMFRMRAAGYRGPDLFSSAVVKYITSASEGLTRRVNLIADKALLAAFAENTHTLRPKHIDAAVRDSEFSQHALRRIERRYWWGAGLIAAGAVGGIAIYALVQHGFASIHPSRAAPASSSPLADRIDSATLANPGTLASAPLPPAATTVPESGATPAAAVPAASVAAVPEPKPAPSVSGGEITDSAKTDPLEARLAATQEWLAAEPQGTYSIQLLGAENPQHLKHHLNVIGKTIEMNKIFVYRTKAKQKPSLTVLYGSFSDRREARQALETLPPQLRAYRPILRTVEGIRSEMRQHQTIEQASNANS